MSVPKSASRSGGLFVCIPVAQPLMLMMFLVFAVVPCVIAAATAAAAFV